MDNLLNLLEAFPGLSVTVKLFKFDDAFVGDRKNPIWIEAHYLGEEYGGWMNSTTFSPFFLELKNLVEKNHG